MDINQLSRHEIRLSKLTQLDTISAVDGDFQMGDNYRDGFIYERPIHTIAPANYFISKFKITQKLWLETLSSNPAKFLANSIWWFYLYWKPKFLSKNYGITLDKIGLPLIIIYIMADVGSIVGGWLSSFFIKRGYPLNKGRKAAMLIMTCCVVPIVFASQESELWIAIVLLSLATAAHQGWSANLFTTVSDLFPKKAVASVLVLEEWRVQ